MPNLKKQKIIISCGGTGGHIFPGIEIAKELNKKNIDILFVGALGKMEMQRVPKQGFSIIGLWIQGLYRKSILKNVLFPLKLIISLLHSFVIIIIHRPDAILGTGGFASGPILFVGSLMGIKTYIQEQNFCAGLTNRLLSKYVNKIFVAHTGMEKFFPKHKLLNFGNPVRDLIISPSTSQQSSRLFFKLKPNKFTILLIGGSLGAEPLNKSIKNNLDTLLKNNCQLIWQTGLTAYDSYNVLKSNDCSVHGFIERMDLAYAAADIVISRAGAIAIAEICCLSKPSILIPSPHVTDDHQKINAEYLVKNEACLLVEEKHINIQLIDSILLLKSRINNSQMGKNAHQLFEYDSAKKIASIILQNL